MNQDRALESRTRFQYDTADKMAYLTFRQSMMALTGSQLGVRDRSTLDCSSERLRSSRPALDLQFTPESVLRLFGYNQMR